MRRPVFNRNELERKLRDIGSSLKHEVKVYLLGGCAMTFRGQKSSTKDVDFVVDSPQSLKHLVVSMKSLGFSDVIQLPEDYQKLGASFVMRDSDGFQVDLFYKRVCNGLDINDRIERRAKAFGIFNNLHIYLMAPEDIFLFKGITEREADLDDMRILVEGGIDWNIVKEECLLQEKRQIWEALLTNKLLQLKERYGIESPIIKDLMEAADSQLVKIVFIKIIREGNNTFDKIADAVKLKYGYSRSWTRGELKKLVEKRMIRRNMIARTYNYSVPN